MAISIKELFEKSEKRDASKTYNKVFSFLVAYPSFAFCVPEIAEKCTMSKQTAYLILRQLLKAEKVASKKIWPLNYYYLVEQETKPETEKQPWHY